MALLLPFYATAMAGTCLAWSLAVLGVLGIGGVFVAENGFKATSLLFGIINLYLFRLMANNPLSSLNALTFWISAVSVSEGFHETAFAIRNKDLPNRGWNFLSGISSIAIGAYAFISMPYTSLVVPGIALGVNFITTGISKIAIGLAGQEEANDRMGYAT